MKKAKSPSAIAQELRSHFASLGVNNSLKIATKCKISQSQVYRNLYGKPKRLTKTLKKLCEYANISTHEEVKTPDPSTSAPLMKALSKLWDGSDEHAQRISRILFALKQADV